MTQESMRVRIALILGAKWRRFKDCHYVRLTFREGDKYVECERPEKVLISNSVPNYHSDLNAAIQLCDHLAEKGWHVTMNRQKEGQWWCCFSKPMKSTTHYTTANTLAEAISGAFLRVHGVGEGE